MSTNSRIQPTAAGNPAPLGAAVQDGGTNFSVYSRHALSVDLLLFGDGDQPQARQVIALDPQRNRTRDYWHVFVPGVGHGQVYAWRVRGPHQPDHGHLFDGDKVLLDPYGRAVCGTAGYSRQAARARGDNEARALRSVVIDNNLFDWEGDRPLPAPAGREFIYEMHAAGFTRSPSSGLPDDLRGTYAGLVEKIPYLVELGVTAVELMPVHQFDPQDAPRGRTNFWGYSTVNFFSPHSHFSSDRSPAGPVDEFREMVKALHRAGLRVILDVVYNHTAEGGPDGPTISWRGLDNSTYYILQEDRSRYADFTGCGNTLNSNHPVVRRLILDSLRYWVDHMHVDGFRFDLGSALTRGENGQPLDRPPVVWALDSDPALAGTTMIAEAWDAAGLYQVGHFPGHHIGQWNGPFRDDVRRFLRGDDNVIENLMARLVGSPDLFRAPGHGPRHCLNFVTSHDGFSLADLVAYEKKHNLANGEENRDGSDHNLSRNHGVEGPSEDPKIESLRCRQIRNFLTLLMLSHGNPMLTMGDEVRHTRRGNNNPWCQDNELNWFDWSLVETNADLLRFMRELSAFANGLPILNGNRFWRATSPESKGDITWHGTKVRKPDWRPASHHLAFTLTPPAGEEQVHVMLNAEAKSLEFQVPAASSGMRWHKVLDTGALPPGDFFPPEKAPHHDTASCRLAACSIVVLLEAPPGT